MDWAGFELRSSGSKGWLDITRRTWSLSRSASDIYLLTINTQCLGRVLQHTCDVYILSVDTLHMWCVYFIGWYITYVMCIFYRLIHYICDVYILSVDTLHMWCVYFIGWRIAYVMRVFYSWYITYVMCIFYRLTHSEIAYKNFGNDEMTFSYYLCIRFWSHM